MKQKLISALKKCADAHYVECVDAEDGVSFISTSIPLLSDLRMIAQAFFGTSVCIVHADAGWGITDFHTELRPMLKQIDEGLLKMALPYATEL